MSFKTMTEANQEFVTKLYGLKAGLSLLSLQAERMNVIEQQDKFLKDCLEDKRSQLACTKRLLSEQYDAKVKAEELLARMKKKLVLHIVGACVPMGIAVLMMFAILMCVVTSLMDGDTELLSSMLPMFLISEVVALLFGAFILFDTIRKHGTKRYVKDLNMRTQSWEESRKRVAELTEQVTKEDAAYEQFHTVEHPKTVAEVEERSKAIYKALHEEYNDVLENRDWGSVDYLIYVYETMRADNLPAALEKLDTEKRANRLEQAIAEASEHIASSIEDSMQSMGSMLSAQLNELGNRVEASNRKVAASIDAASAAASRQAAALNTSMAAQNALLAKANVSSASIAKDVGYMMNSYKTMGSIDVRLK